MLRIVHGFLTVFLLALLWAPPARGEPLKGRNLVELGLYGGTAFLDSQHEFYQFPSHQQQPFKDVLTDLGLRVAYLPTPWVGAEIEGGILPTQTENNNNALLYTVRAHALFQLPLATVVPFLVGGGGFMGVTSNALGNDVDGTFHWGVGLKAYLARWLILRVDGRHLIAGKVGPGGLTNNFELLAGLGVVLNTPKPPAPEEIPTPAQHCPDVVGHTAEGCPVRKDSDGDGIPDGKDKCPFEAAPTTDGCPYKDSDGDGVPDELDHCPTVAAKDPTGCPPKDVDADHDGIVDDKDLCPNEPETENGFEDEDGCPDELPKQIKEFAGSIPGILFPFGRAEVRSVLFPALDRTAELLITHPTVRLVIRGHTDSRGTQPYNLELSRKRAESVKSYLMNRGIAEDRLRVEGLGPDEPVATNLTAIGRAKNRRIEFKIDTKPHSRLAK